MKKNKMMRLAAVLLVMTMLTTCAISGTFAKYTSTVTTKDVARVAYWGFNAASLTTLDLFKYDATDVTNTSGTVNGLIAPGTKNEISLGLIYTDGSYDSSVIAAPEVKYELDVTVTLSGSYDKLEALDSFSFTLNGAKKTLAEIKTELEAATGTYEAGTLPALFQNTAKLGWEWAFDGNDTADTALGNAADLQNVSIEIEIKATQANA